MKRIRRSRAHEIIDGKRQCSKCQEWKSFSEFRKSKHHRDGLRPNCKSCDPKYKGVLSEKKFNQEIYGKKNCAKCKELKPLSEFQKGKAYLNGRRSYCKKCAAAMSREWHKHNSKVPPRKPARSKEETKRANREYQKRKRQEEPEKVRGLNRIGSLRYLARKFKAEGHFTFDEWIILLEYYDHQCLNCGCREKIEADHVIPLSRGGSNYITNIQPLCKSCNSSKGNKIIDYRINIPEWIKTRNSYKLQI